MPEILLCRQENGAISEADREAVRRVVFGVVDGLGHQQQKRWRRFWGWLMKMEPGEVCRVSTLMERSGPYHRRHFAIEQAVFDAQERFENFDQFRVWLKVGAGWVTWAAGPKGGVVPIPNSVSYAKADEMEFREFHERVIGFLRGQHAAVYLWPHLKSMADEMMNQILEGFQE